jgi:SAM-dependent methyltransferase
MLCRGIDLSGVNPRDIGLSEERSFGHKNSGGPDLEKLLQTLPICRSDTVLDFGCGKGGAMLTLAKYPFARVDGIELSPQLARTARYNLRRLRISNATIYCVDAADFTDLDSYTYFYMYNPFPEVVMRSVIGNVLFSLKQQSRKAILIYKHPQMHNLITNAGFRKLTETRQTHHPFATYIWEPVSHSTAQERLVRG